jgi:hypothetical protein
MFAPSVAVNWLHAPCLRDCDSLKANKLHATRRATRRDADIGVFTAFSGIR